MKISYLALVLFALLSAKFTTADTVITKDGSLLNGTVTLVDKGFVYLSTTYAGNLKLKQTIISSLETDKPMALRLKDGTVTSGMISANKNGLLAVESDTGIVTTRVIEIAASWQPSKVDPEIDRNRRKWKNNFAVDLNGRTGNVERFNLGMELDLRLKGPRDELYLGFEYEQGDENGNKTEDRALGQISYERFGKKKLGWFILSSLETDPLNDVYLRSMTSSGSSYRWINNDVQTFVSRNGLGYRFTDFESEGSDTESSLTFETSFIHTLKFQDWFYIENEVSYSPSLSDPGRNYNLAHESSVRIPIGNGESFWIRIGMRNEYESLSSANEKLDTNYYSQLIYSWK